MALTLLEAAKFMPEQEAVFVEQYANSAQLLQLLPFRDVPSGALPYNQEHILPGIGFRGINEAFSESTGVINPQVEVCKISGGDCDVDRYQMQTQGDQIRAIHEMMKVKSLAHAWVRTFFKGNSATDPRVFDGLQQRITGTQLISNAAAGAALSLAKLDEALDVVDGSNKVMFMNRTLRRRLSAVSKSTTVSGFVTYEPSDFGYQVMSYNGIPIYTVDWDETDAQILDFTESSPDGSSSVLCSSIYILNIGDMGVTGIQTAPMSVRDLGELQTQPVFRTRVEWAASFAVMSGRSVARLSGILNSPA
ncbi:MAG: major capsid protein, partial [Sphaerospermopsis kisseleviana]